MRTRLILAGLIFPAVLAVAASPARLSIIKKPKVPATPTPAPALATPAPAAMADTAEGLPPEHVKFFEDNIAPLLADKCYYCHSVAEGKSKGGLTMDTREALRRYFEVDAPSIVLAVLSQLVAEGTIVPAALEDAIARYSIPTDGPVPWHG